MQDSSKLTLHTFRSGALGDVNYVTNEEVLLPFDDQMANQLSQNAVTKQADNEVLLTNDQRDYFNKSNNNHSAGINPYNTCMDCDD